MDAECCVMLFRFLGELTTINVFGETIRGVHVSRDFDMEISRPGAVKEKVCEKRTCEIWLEDTAENDEWMLRASFAVDGCFADGDSVSFDNKG